VKLDLVRLDDAARKLCEWDNTLCEWSRVPEMRKQLYREKVLLLLRILGLPCEL
jgi:hypothetical protein